jgi:hypothetical protein
MKNADAAIHRIRERGRIWIYIHTQSPQTMEVVDDGIGMNADTMERRLFTLGVDPEDPTERSLFGRGLRDVLMSGRAGEVASIASDGVLYHALFRMPAGSFLKSVWADDHGHLADATLRLTYRLPSEGTGTSVRVWLDPQHSRLPASDRLYYVVRNLVQCRPIYEDGSRLVYLAVDGAPLQQVTYDSPPIAATLLDETVQVEGFPAAYARIVVHRSAEEFPLTKIERHIRRGGLLVRSGRAAHAASYFGFEGWDGTRRLFGSVTCDAIDSIQREAIARSESEAIVFSDRSGLNPDHPFTQSLTRIINEKLQPLVESEEGGKAPTRAMAESVKNRRERGLRELNRMAARILTSMGKGPAGRRTGVRPGQNAVPSERNGSPHIRKEQGALPAPVFFPQPVYFLKPRLKRTIKALVDMNECPAGSDIEVILEDDTAGRATSAAQLPASKTPIQSIRIELVGGEARARSTLLLRVGSNTAETEIIVQSHRGRGIFSELKPVDQDNPYMQARFNASSGVVEIFTGRPEFASLLRAGERAMDRLHALDYPPYEVKEIDAALSVVYQFLAERDQARLPENQNISPQVLQARVLSRIEELRYEWDAKLMKAFLSDATYEGRVKVAPESGPHRGRTRARGRGPRVSTGKQSTA